MHRQIGLESQVLLPYQTFVLLQLKNRAEPVPQTLTDSQIPPSNVSISLIKSSDKVIDVLTFIRLV